MTKPPRGKARELTGSGLKYLLAIEEYIAREGWFPGVRDLAEVFGYSTTAIVEALGRLERMELVECAYIGDKRYGKRRPNSIRLSKLGKDAIIRESAEPPW